MGAYEDVRRDVWQQYQAATRAGAGDDEEGLGHVLPGVEVSASQPAWLGPRWRAVLIVFSLLTCATALALTWWAVQRADAGIAAANWAAALGGVIAVVALVVAYLTVGGFGEASFAISSGDDDARGRRADRRIGEAARSGERRAELRP
ncbi:hypothetical protein E1262_25195 [Jiangella aurantiaca]|uniref:Uncharacterized protein n=1 Tax=Jiangella aurantiaca TaxID=2530373 RepID=A0A4R5A4A6_9ACTN|nr:hypothetical protein [Jiangella aurantiaca]TDD65479.1 hypothetical protein E1262_25195 [Jiangella aurantiaca]